MRFDPASLKYDANGLIPCIAQDHVSGEVLMMAWMNRASLETTTQAINLVGVTTGLIAANLLGCFPRRISETKYTARIFLISVLASFTAGSASALRTQLHEGSGAATELVGWFFADLCTYLIVLPIVLSAPTLEHIRRTCGPSVRQSLRLRQLAQILAPLAALLACLPLALEVQGALALLLPMPERSGSPSRRRSNSMTEIGRAHV